MKHGIILSIIAVFSLIASSIFFGSCRSSHSAVSVSSGTEKVFRAAVRHAADSSRTVVENRDSSTAVATESTYERTTVYTDSGRIRSVSERWRQAGSAKLAISTGRSSAVSVGSSGSTVLENQESESKSETKTNNKTDSRPIQGHEWIYVSLVVSLLIFIPIFLIKRKIWKLPF